MSELWESAADLRRRQIEGGLDLTFSQVFLPLYRGLVSRRKPQRVLEVGGGTGHLALELSREVSEYTFVESSPGMCRVAREVLSGSRVAVHNLPIQQFVTDRPFNLVISHLCMQTADDLHGFWRAIVGLLLSDGAFLVSIPHPAFYNSYKKLFAPEDFSYMQERRGLVSFTITLDPNNPIADVPYIHRPLSAYIGSLGQAGLCLTSMEEIFPPESTQKLYGALWETPRYLLLTGAAHRT